ncbi:MAG: hypothetical protein ACYDH5_08240 [Acidimicrobiales bacterium]
MSTSRDQREAQRVKAALHDFLGQVGLSDGRSDWWTWLTPAELGGRTPTRALLDGDEEAAKAWAEGLYEASARTARRVASDPKLVAFLTEKMASIPRHAHAG